MPPRKTRQSARDNASSPPIWHSLEGENIFEEDALDSGDAPSASTSDSYRGSDTEVAARGSGSRARGRRHPRSHPYVPRTGVVREKNKDAQKRYRQRQKEQKAAAEAALSTAAAEVATLRAEQVALREQSRALELLRHYSESLINALRSAAGSFTSTISSAATSVLSLQSDILDYLWNKALHPSDAQLRFLARHVDYLPANLSNVFVGRLVAAVEQWHRSPPAAREAVETKLSGIFESRSRLVSIVLTEFPETKEAHVLRPRDGDISALHSLIDSAASLSSPDVLEAVVLAEHQIEALNSQWDVYMARYNGAKGLLAAASAHVHLSTEEFVSELHSMRGVTRRNADARHGAAAADAFLAEERAARADLLAAASRTLNPIQCAWLQLMAVRVLPSPDIVGAVKHVLPHMVRAPVPTPAALLKLFQGKVAVGNANGA